MIIIGFYTYSASQIHFTSTYHEPMMKIAIVVSPLLYVKQKYRDRFTQLHKIRRVLQRFNERYLGNDSDDGSQFL